MNTSARSRGSEEDRALLVSTVRPAAGQLPSLEVATQRSEHRSLPGPSVEAEPSVSRRAEPAAVYLDPRALTRDCVGRWLQANLTAFEVQRHAHPEDIVASGRNADEIGVVIVNTGPEPMASAAGSRLLAQVTELLPDVPIVVFSDHDDAANIFEAFELGVRGYIPTSLASVVAVEAIRLVCAGGTYAPPAPFLLPWRQQNGASSPQPLAGSSATQRFTERQAQILDRLQRGMPNKLIAHDLSMCESTVKVHIRNIMKKLNATNRTQVVCLTRGLLPARSSPAG